jgi:ribosome maturation factor RimP
MLGPDAEAIKYEQYDAVLKKEGNGWNLQLLIGDDFCEAKLNGGSDDFLLKVMSQAAVDQLAKALST